MTVKSIRKDDVNITAKDLGVKVGDKFVVLAPEHSFDNKHHNYTLTVGDILSFHHDDGSSMPLFRSENLEQTMYESFACLARYEEQLEEWEKTPQNSKLTEASYSVEAYPVSGSRFTVEGLTLEQHVRIITFINNIK